MHQLLLATRNAHKTREFSEILGPAFTVRDLTESTLPAVEETGLSFEENAVLKALATSRVTPELVIADDSGLEVEALNGAPGIYSARYAGELSSDQENVEKLLATLRSVDPLATNRGARFCCAIALAREGKLLRVFHGAVDGTIIDPPRGQRGFGYDPVFAPLGYNETFAELGDDVKNCLSHRAAAIAQLRAHFNNEL